MKARKLISLVAIYDDLFRYYVFAAHELAAVFPILPILSEEKERLEQTNNDQLDDEIAAEGWVEATEDEMKQLIKFSKAKLSNALN
tara:strand:- start:890 stop:1147 length:258 start_codon:yes stop_codon:yes gene_type:complete